MATDLVPTKNAEAYRASTDAAGMCKEIVVSTAMVIQGRKYVKVEGWQSIAVAHGCTASARDVEKIDGGVRAIGEIRRMSDGVVIAEAEGFVGEDEPTWYGGEVVNQWGKKQLPKRPDYAIRAMAQTRAISRACRSAFAHVVMMMNAGLSTTPAEEVPLGGFDDMRDVTPPKGRKAANGSTIDAGGRFNANQCKTEPVTRWDTGEVTTKALLAAKLAHEMTDILEVTELLAWKRQWASEIETWPLKWEEKMWEEYELHMADVRAVIAKDHEGEETSVLEDDEIPY